MASTGKPREGHLERTAAEPRDAVRYLSSTNISLYFSSSFFFQNEYCFEKNEC